MSSHRSPSRPITPRMLLEFPCPPHRARVNCGYVSLGFPAAPGHRRRRIRPQTRRHVPQPVPVLAVEVAVLRFEYWDEPFDAARLREPPWSGRGCAGPARCGWRAPKGWSSTAPRASTIPGTASTSVPPASPGSSRPTWSPLCTARPDWSDGVRRPPTASPGSATDGSPLHWTRWSLPATPRSPLEFPGTNPCTWSTSHRGPRGPPRPGDHG